MINVIFFLGERMFKLPTILLLLIWSSQLSAVDYTSSPPLTKKVSTSVSSCKTGSQVQVPLITWGGDINTVYANGSQINTDPESILGKKGLKLKLVREDVFAKQVTAFLECKSPFLRGTLSMINMASEIANKDARTKLKVIYQMTWSAGGDAMVVKSGIKGPKDLKGKTIAVQAYGPHLDYLGKVLSDSGVSFKDVKIKWVEDLTGTSNTPMAAFQTKDVDAAMVIIPDALALTSGGNVGTGAEDSVQGAKILLSTKSANRIIADVYAVRADFFEANRKMVADFVSGLMESQTQLAKLMKEKSQRAQEYNQSIKVAAKILLDSEQAIADTEGMYADAEFLGFADNRRFFGDPSYPRRFDKLNKEIQETLKAVGLLAATQTIDQAKWDYDKLKQGNVGDASTNDKSRFKKEEVAKVVTRRRQKGVLEDGSLFSFELFFKPNQNDFSADLYSDDFKKVIELASTYGGAVITVEGHSDPLGYLKKKKSGASPLVLSRIVQAGKNLSLSRANAVRDSLIGFAKKRGVTLDPNQFAIVGMGIENPATGKCGEDPCAPKTNEEWLQNMRVQFRLIQVEAEEAVFQPL